MTCIEEMRNVERVLLYKSEGDIHIPLGRSSLGGGIIVNCMV
jgi:hypothetical protein